jgi:hypothetical protein
LNERVVLDPPVFDHEKILQFIDEYFAVIVHIFISRVHQATSEPLLLPSNMSVPSAE